MRSPWLAAGPARNGTQGGPSSAGSRSGETNAPHLPAVNTSDLTARRNAITIGSGALAAPALAIPIPWLFVALALRLASGALRRTSDATSTTKTPINEALSATLESAKRKASARVIPALFNGVITLVVAVAIVVLLSGVPWLMSRGTDGALVAARLGAYDHLLPLFAALLCLRIVRGRGGKGGVVETALDHQAGAGPDSGLSLVSAAGCVVIVLFVFAVPSAPWAPWGSFESAAGALPPATRDAIFAVREDVVSSEVRAVLRCLASKGRDLQWVPEVFEGTKPGTVTVTIRRDAGASGESRRSDVTALALALDNQLPAGVTRVSIQRVARFSPLLIDRTKLRRDGPGRSTAALAAAAGVGHEVLPRSQEAVSLGLRCGAVAL